MDNDLPGESILCDVMGDSHATSRLATGCIEPAEIVIQEQKRIAWYRTQNFECVLNIGTVSNALNPLTEPAESYA
jgi:hypothetical protein